MKRGHWVFFFALCIGLAGCEIKTDFENVGETEAVPGSSGTGPIIVEPDPTDTPDPLPTTTPTPPISTSPSSACAALPPATSNIRNVTLAEVSRTAGGLAAIIRGVAANTTILLEDGTYRVTGATNSDSNARISFSNPGITLRSASGDPSRVIIDGAYTGYLIWVTQPNITIAELTLRHAYYHLIHATATGQRLKVYRVNLEDSRQQFIKGSFSNGLYPDDGIVSCSNFIMSAEGRSRVDRVSTPCYTGGIDVHGGSNWKVSDNRFEGIYCDGGLSEHAVHFWSGSRGTLVERNKIINCARGVGFGLGQGTGGSGGTRTYPDIPVTSYVGHYLGIIRNNMIFTGRVKGTFDVGISLEQAKGAQVYHNTIYQLVNPNDPAIDLSGHSFLYSIDYRFANSDPIIKNNLVNPPMVNRGASAATVLAGNIQNVPITAFVNPEAGDLHLTSPLTSVVGRGVSLGTQVPLDFDGDTRKALPDVGADEYTP